MSFSLPQILLLTLVYLSGLFAVAHLANRGVIPRRVTHHPSVYVLSLGVFGGALATNGVFAPAYSYGSSYLVYYLGVVLMFIFAPVLLLPLLRLCRVYQLASLADVLTFRFRSQAVGAAVTLAMCAALLPLLALQIQAVADSIRILVGGVPILPMGEHQQAGPALLFCLIITVFAILFGTRHSSPQQRNTGLVTAIAFESLVKLAAMLALGGVAVFGVFDGPAGLEQWLEQPSGGVLAPDAAEGVEGTRVLLLIFFAGAVCMPHIFHMTFAENTESGNLRTASWALPLYLLLLALPVLPVLWASSSLGHQLPVEHSGLALGLALQSSGVTALAFVAGLSASSATIIVTTLALANMCLNHLVLPGRLRQLHREQDIFRQLRWLRRGLIAGLILAGYVFFALLDGRHSLSQLGLVAFVGVLQFLPGLVATPYWTRANRLGLLSGLGAGLACWFFGVLKPLTTGSHPEWLQALSASGLAGSEPWAAATLLSVCLNCGLFVLVSLLTRAGEEEQVAADICFKDDLSRPVRQTLAQRSAAEFAGQLALALGDQAAEREVGRALQQLQFGPEESRPYALRRLRNRVEANLSGLLGPAVANNIVNRCLPFSRSLQGNSEDINLIERNLDRAQIHFTGLAADLDNLRRHYRETLDNLPIGVCSVGIDDELVLWNRSMQEITGIRAGSVVGSHRDSLPDPWRDIIGDFLQGETNSVLKQEVVGNASGSRWISLNRASAEAGTGGSTDRVILVEDITDYEMLEEELLHNERLASIGRLAAGVAHEIGNPVTGIACLAQNLEYETETEEIRNTAQDILKQTDRVTRIVQSLVNFSHAGSGPGDTELTPCNLADCIDEAVHLLQLDRQAKAVIFENHCDRELVVMADSQRLLQVFVNILGNARDACDQDGRVRAAARDTESGIAVTVDDNGCGIPPESHSQVFEPFYTTKEPGEGTGLGLALVYSIMEDMGGSVQLQSPICDQGPPGTRCTLQLARGCYGSEFQL